MSRCEAFRDLIQERIDGDLPEERARELGAHLEICPACRESESDLAAIVTGLRDLPMHPMPEDALAAILDLTVRGQRPSSRSVGHRSRIGWAWGAAAAVAAACVAAILLVPGPSSPNRPSAAEIARARLQVRTVMIVTAGALRRAEAAASRRVLSGEVAPALSQIPIRWSALRSPRKS